MQIISEELPSKPFVNLLVRARFDPATNGLKEITPLQNLI